MNSEFLVAISVPIAALWATAVIVSRLWHRVVLGLPIFTPAYSRLLPYASKKAAWRAADDRRDALQTFLRDTEGARLTGREFIERPPMFPDAERLQAPYEFSDRFQQAWRASRLHLQLEKDRYLLVERVVDAIVSLHRAGKISSSEFPHAVRLEPINVSRGDRFPWRVVIDTTHPEVLEQWFSKEWAGGWFGIGIYLCRRRGLARRERGPGGTPFVPSGAENNNSGLSGAAVPMGLCVLGDDGLEGVAGGAITGTQTGVGLVTCRHVLSSTCGSVIWPSPPVPVHPPDREFTQESPDVALLRDGATCLGAERRRRVTVGALSDLEVALKARTSLVKAPRRDRRRGVIYTATMAGFKLGSHFYRGPHFGMTPDFRKYLGIVWPLSRRFSVAGDSGSWIVDGSTRTWLGVLIGGYRWPNTTTVALSAHYVLDAMERLQQSSSVTAEAADWE